MIPGSKNTLADLELPPPERAGRADRSTGPAGRHARSSASAAASRCWAAKSAIRWPSNRPPWPAAGTGAAGDRHGHGRREDARPHHRHPRRLRPGGRRLRNPSRPDRARTTPLPSSAGPTARWSAPASADGRVWGTYLHGVFDADPFRRWFIDRLRVRRGLAPLGRVIAAVRHRAGPGSPGRQSSARAWPWKPFIA